MGCAEKSTWCHSCQQCTAWVCSWESPGWSPRRAVLQKEGPVKDMRNREKTEEWDLYWRRPMDMTIKFNTHSCTWSLNRKGKRDTVGALCEIWTGWVDWMLAVDNAGFPTDHRHAFSFYLSFLLPSQHGDVNTQEVGQERGQGTCLTTKDGEAWWRWSMEWRHRSYTAVIINICVYVCRGLSFFGGGTHCSI